MGAKSSQVIIIAFGVCRKVPRFLKFCTTVEPIVIGYRFHRRGLSMSFFPIPQPTICSSAPAAGLTFREVMYMSVTGRSATAPVHAVQHARDKSLNVSHAAVMCCLPARRTCGRLP